MINFSLENSSLKNKKESNKNILSNFQILIGAIIIFIGMTILEYQEKKLQNEVNERYKKFNTPNTLQNQSIRQSNFRENSLNFVNNKTWRTRDVLLDKKFYYYLPISIAAPYISTGLTFHQIFISNQKAWSLQMLANGFIFLGIFSIIGIIIGGPIVDKYNTKKVIYFTLVPLFFGILALIFFESYFFMMLYMSLLGLSLGIGTPFIGSLWAELYGLESLGSVKALLHALGVFFSALSPVVFGYMIDFGMGVLSISFMSLFIIIFSTVLPFFYNQN